MSYISNFKRTKQGLEQEQRKISELFYVGCTDDYYSLEQIILNVELFTRKRDVEIYFYEPVFDEDGNPLYGKGEIELFAEGREAFYKFIDLTPKYIFENVRFIFVYDREEDLTYRFEGYSLPQQDTSPWYDMEIKKGKKVSWSTH